MTRKNYFETPILTLSLVYVADQHGGAVFLNCWYQQLSAPINFLGKVIHHAQ